MREAAQTQVRRCAQAVLCCAVNALQAPTAPSSPSHWPSTTAPLMLPSLSSFSATLPPPHQDFGTSNTEPNPTDSSLGSAQTSVDELAVPCKCLIQPRSSTLWRVKPCQSVPRRNWDVGGTPRSCLRCWSILSPSTAMGCQGRTLKLFVNEGLYPCSPKLFRRLIQIWVLSGVILKNYWSYAVETY